MAVVVERTVPTWLHVREGIVAETREMSPHGEVLVDYDADGRVIGIEILVPFTIGMRCANSP